MDKIAFQIGSLTVHWYGVFLAIGFLVGLWTASRRGLKGGVSPERILDSGVWLIVGAVIGARLLYVITYWEQSFAGRPFVEVFMVHHGGLVYYGGLIGACLGFILYAWIKKLDLWKMADVMAPSISLGYAIGRNGCLMNGCCFGRATDVPWCVHFPADHETGGVCVHPTQVYESIMALGLYVFLAWLFRRKKFDGQVFAAYLMGYAAARGFVEFFRGDYTVHYLGQWATQAHLISFGIFAAGVVIYVVLSRKKRAVI